MSQDYSNKNLLKKILNSLFVKIFEFSVKMTLSPFVAYPVYIFGLRPKVKKYKNKAVYNKNFKKILQINTADNVGGAAKVAYHLTKGLNNREYDTKMLVNRAFSNENFVEVLEREKSFKQDLLNFFQKKEGWQDFFHLASLNIKNLDIFKNCDLVHLHNLHGDYFSPFALPEISSLKPVIWTLHDMQSITGHCAHSFDCEKWLDSCVRCEKLEVYPEIKKDSADFLWKHKKEIYKNSNLTIVCPSQWLKNKVDKSILGIHDVRLIYNGINQNIFKKTDKTLARQELNLPKDKKILLFNAHGGIHNFWKGGKFLVKSYEALKHREDVLFLNIGSEKTEYKSNNWLDVSYVSEEETIAKFYSACDLFVYPSLADNCPLVVLEALACEIPVIAFKTGGIPELVKHLETGYISEYKNLEDFINGIKLFLDNPDLVKKAGIKGREIVEKCFTIDIMTDNYIKCYQEVMEKYL